MCAVLRRVQLLRRLSSECNSKYYWFVFDHPRIAELSKCTRQYFIIGYRRVAFSCVLFDCWRLYHSKSLLPRVVALLFCLLLFTRIREVVPNQSSQRLLTVAENMVTMISDTCGYVLFLLLLLLVPYIESGECKYIYFRIVQLSLPVNDRVSFKSIIKIINQVSIDCVSHARCMSLQWLMSDPMSYAQYPQIHIDICVRMRSSLCPMNHPFRRSMSRTFLRDSLKIKTSVMLVFDIFFFPFFLLHC